MQKSTSKIRMPRYFLSTARRVEGAAFARFPENSKGVIRRLLSAPSKHEQPAKKSQKANRERIKVGFFVLFCFLPWPRSGFRTGRLVNAQSRAFLHAFGAFSLCRAGRDGRRSGRDSRRMIAEDCPGFAAPPLRPSTGLNRWCNFTSSPWQLKSGGDRAELGARGNGG